MKEQSMKLNAVLNIIRQISTIAFPVITFPYISRILQADNYGKITFGQSIISYFSLIAALGINSYAVREGAAINKRHIEFQNFVNEIFTLNIISTVVSYILLFITVGGLEKLYPYRGLIGIQSLGIIFTTIGVEWIYIINEDYTYITIRSILIQLISMGLMFMLVHKKSDYIIYALISVFSVAGANLFNFVYVKKYVHLGFAGIGSLAKHLKPTLILFCNNIMVSVYINSDITMIGFMRNATEVGIYSAAAKMYTIIKNVINAIVVVAIPRVAFYKNNGKEKAYDQLINRVMKYLMFLLMPIVTGLFIESENVLIIISGGEYVEGYVALRIFCIAMIFSIIAAFLTNLVLLPSKQDRTILRASFVSATSNLGLNLIFIHLWGYVGAAITTAIAEMLVVVLCFFKAKKLMVVRIQFKDFLFAIIGCLGISFVCLICSKWNGNIIVREIIAVTFSVIVYLIVLFMGKNSILFKIIGGLRNKKSK